MNCNEDSKKIRLPVRRLKQNFKPEPQVFTMLMNCGQQPTQNKVWTDKASTTKML